MTRAVLLALLLAAFALGQAVGMNGTSSQPLNVGINVSVTPIAPELVGVSINVLATPINSTAVNVTFISYYVANSTPAPVVYSVALGVVNSTGAFIEAAILGKANVSRGYIGAVLGNFSSSASGYFKMTLNGVSKYNAILYKVYIGGHEYPPTGWFYTLFILPAASAPPPFVGAVPLLGFAVFAALAGRHSLKMAAVGMLVFATVGYGLLSVMGLASPQATAIAVVSWLFGAIALLAAWKIEEQ